MPQITKCYLRDQEGCDVEDCASFGCGYLQLKNEVQSALEEFCSSPPVEIPKHIDLLVNRLKKIVE